MEIKKVASCLLAAALLAACQPTPAEEIIVNKGDGTLEVRLMETPVPEEAAQAADVPDEWRETLEIGDSRVVFDAAVECPVDVFPVFEAEEAAPGVEAVNDVIARLAPDAERVRPVGSSAAELREQLEAAIRGWWYADGSGEGHYGPYEGQEEDIARLQEQLASTGDESAPFAPFESLPVRSTVLCADGRSITVYAYEDCWAFTIDLGHAAVMQGESLVASGGAMGDEPPGTQIGAAAITAEQAVERAREMLETIGFSGMQVASVEKARMVNAVTETVLANGYQIILCRGDGGYAPFDPLLLGHSALQIYEQSGYRKDWRPERMQVFVDERGVRYVGRMFPLHVLRTVNENAALLPFARVQELLRNRFRHEFRWTEVSGGTVTVKRVALVGALVRVKNDLERAYIVPTWLCEYTTDTGGTPEQRYAIAVNAIDGTSVDVLLA